MSAPASPSRSSADDLPILLVVLAVALGGVWMLGHREILGILLRLRGWEMAALGQIPILPHAEDFRDTARGLTPMTAAEIGDRYTWSAFFMLSERIGSALRWPAGILLFFGAVAVGTRGLGRFRRNFLRHDVKARNPVSRLAGQGLLLLAGPVAAGRAARWIGAKISLRFDVPSFVRELALTFPQVAPVVSAGFEASPALSETDFVREHHLLLPIPGHPAEVGPFRFDRAAARQVFSAQLGREYADEPGKRLSDCPPYVWGLVGICLARMSGGAGKEDSEKLIALLARIYGSPTPTVTSRDRQALSRFVAKYERNGEALRVLGRHAWINTAVPALFSAAKKFGQLTTSDVIWLKKQDRTLFYAINQIGRKVAWVEAAGCRAHTDAEDLAGPLAEPKVEAAVVALERRLIKLGLIVEEK